MGDQLSEIVEELRQRKCVAKIHDIDDRFWLHPFKIIDYIFFLASNFNNGVRFCY